MKVVTLGLSPFLMASRAKQHSLIMRYLYLTGHSVASVVWGHNTGYFVPKEIDGEQSFVYDFTYEDDKHEIPIFPFTRGQQESVEVYEILNSLKPELVILVGDPKDFPYLYALSSFYPENIKWLGVLMLYNCPLNQDDKQTIDVLDGVLCTSSFCHDVVKKIYKRTTIDTCFVGTNPKIYYPEDTSEDTDRFRIMSCAKVVQSDCAPTIMSAVSLLQNDIPGIELYMHSNINDPGDHDLVALRETYDPDEKFIKFPDKYVSILDGVSESDMGNLYRKSDIFVSIPMITATSISVFQAMASGCFPVLSDCGSNRDIDELLSKFLGSDFSKEDFLVPCIEVMAAGDTYLHVCGKENLRKKILEAYRKIKKYKGLKKKLSEFTLKYSQGSFLKKVADMADLVLKSNSTICLEESVKGDIEHGRN